MKRHGFLLPLLALLTALAPLAPTRPDEGPAGEVGDGEHRPGRGHLERREYSGLWPFYTHETFEGGRTKVTAFFSAYRSEEEVGGDYHRRIFPLYSTSLTAGGADRRLAVFPLLYWRRRSPDVDHDIVLPLFARWREVSSQHTVFWPLFQQAIDPRPAPFRTIPTVFRHGHWSDQRESRWRLGFPFVFDLLSGASEPGGIAAALGSFFPFGEETASGLPLGKWELTDDHWHAHLFPLFGAGFARGDDAQKDVYFYSALFGFRDRGIPWSFTLPPLLTRYERRAEGYRFHGLFPLMYLRKDPAERQVRLLPFYLARDRFPPDPSQAGRFASEARSRVRFYSLAYGFRERKKAEGARLDHYVPLLLARYGYETSRSDLYSFDILFPMFHSSKSGEKSFALRILPLFDHSLDDRRECLGFGLFLLRRYANFQRDSLSHWLFFPFLHWKRWPTRTLAWAFPVYFSSAKDEPELRSHFRLILPFYYSGKEEVRTGEGDGEWAVTRRTRHLWPAYGRSELKSAFDDYEKTTHHSLYPFFRFAETTGGRDPARPERELCAPWPLLRYRWDLSSWDFRLFPFAYAGSGPESTHVYLYPLLAVSSGPEARRRFLHSFCLVQWHGREKRQSFRLFPLLFHWGRDDERLRVSGPLWWFHYSSSAAEGWFHLLPLGFGNWSEDDLRAGLFPLYYHHEHGAGEIDYWSPARFFFLWNTLSNDRECHVSLLWKAVEYSSGVEGDHDFRVLHRLFVKRRVKGQRELVFNPFFSSSHDKRTGRRSFSILHFLYSYERDGERVSRKILFIPIGGGD